MAADVRCLMPRYTRTEKLARFFRNLVTCQGGQLDLPTYHARVLLLVAHDPGVRLRDIAASLNITERRAFGIITDLAEAGYVVKEKNGRRNRYHIQAHLPLPEPDGRERTVGEVLALLTSTAAPATFKLPPAGGSWRVRVVDPHAEHRASTEDRGNPEAFAHMAIDAGASLVIASGPHVLRGMQFYKGHLIAYSLGNFAGYGNFATAGDLGMSVILHVTLAATGRFESARIYPIQFTGAGARAGRRRDRLCRQAGLGGLRFERGPHPVLGRHQAPAGGPLAYVARRTHVLKWGFGDTRADPPQAGRAGRDAPTAFRLS